MQHSGRGAVSKGVNGAQYTIYRQSEEAKKVKLKLKNILRELKWERVPVSADTCLCL